MLSIFFISIIFSYLISSPFNDWINDNDVNTVRKYDLDVIIRLGFRILKGGILDSAKCGVWSFHHADPANNNPFSYSIAKVCSKFSSLVPHILIACSSLTKKEHIAFGYDKSKISLKLKINTAAGENEYYTSPSTLDYSNDDFNRKDIIRKWDNDYGTFSCYFSSSN